MATSVFTFASSWALSPAGRAELLSAFKATSEGENTQFIAESCNDECISMECAEESFVAFIKLASTYIHAAQVREQDIFEVPKLARIPGTFSIGSASSITEPQARNETSNGQLLEYGSYSSLWVPTKENSEGHKTFHALPTMIRTIEVLTSVHLEGSLTTYEFKVVGDTENSISQAVRKLDTLDEAMLYQPVVHNHPVLEGATSIRLQMLPLKEVSEPRLRTTLLTTKSACYKSLGSAYVVALIRDGEICKLDSISGYENNEDENYLWKDHELTFQSFKKTTSPGISKANPITRWVDESSAAPKVDPFAPSTIEQRVILPSQTSPETLSKKRIRKVKGGALRSTTPFESITAAPFRSAIDEKAEIQTGYTDQMRSIRESQSFATESVNQCSTIRSLSTKDTPHLSPGDNPRLGAATGQLSITEGAIRQPPQIRPPFMPPPSVAPRLFQRNPGNWENTVVPITSGAGILIDLGQPATATQEKPQKEKEHITMLQRSPQRTMGDTALVKNFQQALVRILSSSISRRGVRLEVRIGRILIDRYTIPPEFRKKPFDVREWTYASDHLQTEFTGMLTTKFSDISNILNTKLSQGRRLFAEEPVHRKVIYSIECSTEASGQITIEIDSNRPKDFNIRGAKFQNGAINWHFVKRAWDAQLAVTSEGYSGGCYVQGIGNFVDTIKITQSSNFHGLEYSFDVEGCEFQVQSVFVRRETAHTPILYPDLLLHLVEVQDMKVKQDTKESTHYTGTIESHEEMEANNRLWWEVSVSSQHATGILQENQGLELGEKAHWMSEQVLDNGIVGDMYALAQDLVTKIDHIGIENKRPVENTPRPSERSRELPAGQMGYW